MDARLLYFGLLGNLATVLVPLVGVWSVMSPVLALLLIVFIFGSATILGVSGLFREGRMDMDAAGGIVFGGGVVLVIDSAYLVLSIAGYSVTLETCQGLPAQLSPGPGCSDLPFFIGFICIIAATVTVTAMITVAALVQMRRLSRKQ